MKTKQLVIVLFFAFIAKTFAQYTDQINSNRPGESMGAFSVGKTIIQAEGGLSKANTKFDNLKYKTKGYYADLALRYGAFFEQLEFIGNISYQADKYTDQTTSTNRSGIKYCTIGAKYMIYDPFKNYEETVNLYSWKANHKFKWHSLIPVISAYVGANFNINNKFLYTPVPVSDFSPKAMLITQNMFSGGCVFVTNIYADRIGKDSQTIGYVVTLTKGFNDHWSGFLESRAFKGDYYSDGIFTVGAAYLFDKSLQVDASFSKNVKFTPSVTYFGLGFSWRYDANYQEIKLFKGKSKLDKKMIDKKEKSDKKKRKDAVKLD